MPSIQEMHQDLAAADAAGDTQLAQHIAAKIRENGTIAGEPDLGPFGNSVLAGGLHFAHQIPIVGDAALTAGRLIANSANGEGGDWQHANNDVHAILDSAQRTHPVTSTIGGVAGGVTGAVAGGELLKGAQALPYVGRAAVAARAALAPRAATTFAEHAANVARLAAAGGAAGAVQGGGEQAVALNGNQVLPAAGWGAAGGAVAGAAGGTAAPILGRAAMAGARRFLPGMMKPLDAQAARALSKVYGETPSDLQAAWDQHTAITGQPPSMTELSDYKQRGLISGLAKDSATIADKLNQQQAAAASLRSSNMQATFEQAGAASPSEIGNVRTQQGNIDYPTSRAAPDFSIPTQPDPSLGGVSPADHIAAEILPQAGLGKADRVRIMNGLQQGTLSTQDAQMIRSGLSESLGKNYSPATKGLLTDFDGITHAPGNAASAAPLDTATANFAANSRRTEGAKHGASILSGSSAGDYAATAGATGLGATGGPSADPEFAQGMHLGANDAMSNAASTPQGATALANRLKGDSALQDKLTTTFGADNAAKLQAMGQAHANAAAALTPLSGAPAAQGDSGATVGDVAQLFGAAATHGLSWKAYHVAQFLSGNHMSEAVQAKVADYLSNPNMVTQGVNIMRKAGATEDQLRTMAGAAASAAGIGTGDAVSKPMLPDHGGVTIESVQPATPAELAQAPSQ